MATDIIGFQIEVGGTDAEVQTLGALKAEIFATERELKKLKEQTRGNIGAQKAAREQFSKLETTLKANRSEYTKGQKAIIQNSNATKNAAGSYNALVVQTKTLETRLKSLPGGLRNNSKEFQILTNRVTKNRAEIRAFDARIGKTRQNVGLFGGSLKGAVGSIGRFAGGLGLAVGGVAAIGGAITGAVRTINTFEKSLANVFTLLSQDDLKQFQDELTRGSREVIAKYGLDIENVNKALFDTISAGIPAGEAVEFLNEAARLSIGGVTDLSTATDGLTSVLNAFRLDTSETTVVADAFFSAQKAGKTTVEELSNEIGKVSPIANAAGVSFQELLAATAALTLGGLSTAEATTAIQGTLNALIKPSKEAEVALRALGVPVGLVEVRAKGFTASLAALNKVVKENPDEIAKAIPNIRGLTGVLALSEEGFDAYSEILQQVNEDIGENSSLSAAFAIQQATVEQQVARLGGAYDGFIISLNEGSGIISSTIGSITELGTSFLETLTAINDIDFDKPAESSLGLLKALEAFNPALKGIVDAAEQSFEAITEKAQEEALKLTALTAEEQDKRLKALEIVLEKERKLIEEQASFGRFTIENEEKIKTELRIKALVELQKASLDIRAQEQAALDTQAEEDANTEIKRQERLTKEQQKAAEKRAKDQVKAREDITNALADLEVKTIEDDQARAVAAEGLRFERAVAAAEKRRSLFAKDAEEQQIINIQIQLLTETHLTIVGDLNQKFREKEAKAQQAALKDRQQFLRDDFDMQADAQDARLQQTINDIALQGVAVNEGRLFELEAEALFLEERLALLTQFGEDTTILQQEQALVQQEIDNAKTQIFIDNAERATANIQRGISAVSQLFVIAQNVQLAKFDERAKAELASFKGTEEEKVALEEKLAEERLAIDKKFRQRQKELQLISAIIDVASAVIKAMASPAIPPFPGAIAAGVLGAINIATIASQPLEKGGVLRGPRHAQGGIPIEAEGDEIVLTKGVYQSPRLRSMASSLNVAGGGIAFENGGVPLAKLQAGAILPSFDTALQRQAIISDANAPDFSEIGEGLAAVLNDQQVILAEGDVTETQNNVKVTEALAEL